MAIFVISLLTVVMVLDCLFLILLVLMQLPKKDAGAGLAFGGAATDALFGAGSGNFLTKATKYAAIAFFVFALVLSVMQTHFARRPSSQFRRELEAAAQKVPAAVPAPASAPSTSVAIENTNVPALTPLTGATNAAPATAP
jgi:preprotein translocase subunit SecG